MARKTFWVDNPVDLGIVSAAQQSQSLFTGTPPINTRQTTVVRIIIDLKIFSTTVAGAHGVNFINLGIGMASQEAFNAGIFPDPESDELYKTRCVAFQNGVGTNPLITCYKDIRSGRKVYDGELFLVATNTNRMGTTASYVLGGEIRVLVMLP